MKLKELETYLEEVLNSTDEYPLIKQQLKDKFGYRAELAVINHQQKEEKELRVVIPLPSKKKNEITVHFFIFLGGDFNWKQKKLNKF